MDSSTDNLPKAVPLKELCSKYGIKFKKGLGQNLLLDDNINAIMVEAAGIQPSERVVEVGPGLGALTRRLCRKAGQLLSVEIDPSFMPCLEDQFGNMTNVRLYRGDILNHSLVELIDQYIPGDADLKMVSNLPYYITTPILFHFLEAPIFFSRIVVMLQLEVGERLAARVNTSDYGVLTIAAALRAEVDLVHRVSSSCFVPKPNVDSCIVRFRLRRPPLLPETEMRFVMRVVRAAFSQRRKTLRNSLTHSGAFGAPKESVIAALEAVDIDPGRRPQTVSVEEFIRLAAEIRKRLPHEPGEKAEDS